MTTKSRWILSGTLTLISGLALSIAVFAEPSEVELTKQAKISKAQAEKIAMLKVPDATIRSEEIENEHHALVWSFDMVKAGSKNITEVLVNAKTGKVVSVSTETPKDQAKEAAEDKAAGRK